MADSKSNRLSEGRASLSRANVGFGSPVQAKAGARRSPAEITVAATTQTTQSVEVHLQAEPSCLRLEMRFSLAGRRAGAEPRVGSMGARSQSSSSSVRLAYCCLVGAILIGPRGILRWWRRPSRMGTNGPGRAGARRHRATRQRKPPPSTCEFCGGAVLASNLKDRGQPTFRPARQQLQAQTRLLQQPGQSKSRGWRLNAFQLPVWGREGGITLLLRFLSWTKKALPV